VRNLPLQYMEDRPTSSHHLLSVTLMTVYAIGHIPYIYKWNILDASIENMGRIQVAGFYQIIFSALKSSSSARVHEQCLVHYCNRVEWVVQDPGAEEILVDSLGTNLAHYEGTPRTCCQP